MSNAMNEAALATIHMSVKPVPLNTVTSVDKAKEAWDALTVMFKAKDNALNMTVSCCGSWTS